MISPDEIPAAGDLLGRGARGAVALGVRQFLVQALSMAAAIVLARVLTPAEFGVYGVTVFLMHFLVVFGDAGLGAGLVREHEEPDERDYRAIFTFQQAMVAAVAAAGLLLSPQLSALLAPDGEIGLLVPALFASLVLASFQTLPAARLERHLQFDRLAIVEVAQGIAFNVVAVAGALAGFGANAMAAALVTRAAAGAVVVQMVTSWPIAWGWDWRRVRSRLRFGLSFQGAALINLLRDALVPVFVGATLGSAAVGSIFFARMLATYPFMVVYMLQRLLMPLFARLQTKPTELARAVNLSLFAVAALVVPVQTTVWSLQEPLTRIVFGAQWVESLPVFRWWWMSSLLEPQLVVALALLNAVGRADRTLRLVAVTSVAMWVAGVPLLLLVGPTGVGIASTLLLVLKWPVVREADAASRTASTTVVVPVWAAAIAAAVVTTGARLLVEPTGVASLALLGTLSLLCYAGFLAVLAPRRSRAGLAWLRSWGVQAMASLQQKRNGAREEDGV